jgi:hypothetical protein
LSRDGHAVCSCDLIRRSEVRGRDMSEKNYGKCVSLVMRVRGCGLTDSVRAPAPVRESLHHIEPAVGTSGEYLPEAGIDPSKDWHGMFDTVDWETRENAAESVSPVFDLLDPSASFVSEAPIARSGEEAVGRASTPLIGALYEQYREALVSPFAGLSATWVDAAEAASEGVSNSEAGEGHSSAPVASVLGDIATVEQAFGMFEEFDFPDVKEVVPEILSLFAPPEHRAVWARRAEGVPPELTRREHHALSLDSPM